MHTGYTCFPWLTTNQGSFGWSDSDIVAYWDLFSILKKCINIIEFLLHLSFIQSDMYVTVLLKKYLFVPHSVSLISWSSMSVEFK